MLNPVISVIVYFAEMLISYIFFSSTTEKKYASGKFLLIGTALFGAACMANLLFKNNVVVNTATTILANCLFAGICFENKFMLSIFYTFILIAVSAVWEFTAISAVTALTKSHFFDYNNDLELFLLECPISKTLYFFTVLILSRIVTPGEYRRDLPMKLFIHPAATTICLVIFWIVCAHSGISADGQSMLSIASIILLVSTVLLFVTYQHQVEQDREAIQMKSEFERLQTEKAYYDILEQQNQQLMMYAHDAKNHLAAIRTLNDDPQIGAYVSQLATQLAEYTHNCHSGSKMLDVMIHKFNVDCSMRGVQFDYDVKLCNLSKVDDMDLVTILGNLIDNAVTAAENSREKKVFLATAFRNSYSVIIVKNSCDTQPKTKGTRYSAAMRSKNDSDHDQLNAGRGLFLFKQYVMPPICSIVDLPV